MALKLVVIGFCKFESIAFANAQMEDWFTDGFVNQVWFNSVFIVLQFGSVYENKLFGNLVFKA